MKKNEIKDKLYHNQFFLMASSIRFWTKKCAKCQIKCVPNFITIVRYSHYMIIFKDYAPKISLDFIKLNMQENMIKLKN